MTVASAGKQRQHRAVQSDLAEAVSPRPKKEIAFSRR
jgi:hypothetical protein